MRDRQIEFFCDDPDPPVLSVARLPGLPALSARCSANRRGAARLHVGWFADYAEIVWDEVEEKVDLPVPQLPRRAGKRIGET
jgi:hypothetical protein